MAECEVKSPVSRPGSKVGSGQPMSPGARAIHPWAQARRLIAFRHSPHAHHSTKKLRCLHRLRRWLARRTDLCKPKRVQFRTIRGSGPLPSISVEPSFQPIAKTADPTKIKEQLRHANEQLE